MKFEPMQLPSSSNVISSIAAIAKPSVRPPMIWPSTIIGLIRIAAVVDGDHAQHLPRAGAAVDLDDDRVASRTGTSCSAGRSSGRPRGPACSPSGRFV